MFEARARVVGVSPRGVTSKCAAGQPESARLVETNEAAAVNSQNQCFPNDPERRTATSPRNVGDPARASATWQTGIWELGLGCKALAKYGAG